jgi:hypothetical protein
MSETIKRNERENFELKKKCEQTDIALIDLAEEVHTLHTHAVHIEGTHTLSRETDTRSS